VLSGALIGRAARLWAVMAILKGAWMPTNYALTYMGANLTIAARPLTGGLPSAQSKVYGEADRR